jgi:hypothetical protein
MNMMTFLKYAKILVLTIAVGAAQAPFVLKNAYASDIRVTVNKIPIT